MFGLITDLTISMQFFIRMIRRLTSSSPRTLSMGRNSYVPILPAVTPELNFGTVSIVSSPSQRETSPSVTGIPGRFPIANCPRTLSQSVPPTPAPPTIPHPLAPWPVRKKRGLRNQIQKKRMLPAVPPQ